MPHSSFLSCHSCPRNFWVLEISRLIVAKVSTSSGSAKKHFVFGIRFQKRQGWRTIAPDEQSTGFAFEDTRRRLVSLSNWWWVHGVAPIMQVTRKGFLVYLGKAESIESIFSFLTFYVVINLHNFLSLESFLVQSAVYRDQQSVDLEIIILDNFNLC